MNGELSGSIPAQRVTPSWRSFHVGERWRSKQTDQAFLEELPVVRSPVPPALAIIGARLLQFLARPRDFDDSTPEFHPWG